MQDSRLSILFFLAQKKQCLILSDYLIQKKRKISKSKLYDELIMNNNVMNKNT